MNLLLPPPFFFFKSMVNISWVKTGSIVGVHPLATHAQPLHSFGLMKLPASRFYLTEKTRPAKTPAATKPNSLWRWGEAAEPNDATAPSPSMCHGQIIG